MSGCEIPVILLEDDHVQRELLADGLAHAGYSVIGAATGLQAKLALASVDGRAVLVADRSLGRDGPNGFQLAAEALGQYAALRVVYVSGTHIAVRRRVLGERERALLKPFAMTQLLVAVRDLTG